VDVVDFNDVGDRRQALEKNVAVMARSRPRIAMQVDHGNRCSATSRAIQGEYNRGNR
jgi:hypothetical protein